MGDVGVEPDGVHPVEPVGAESGEDVRQTGGDTATRHDPAPGGDGERVALQLLERLGVVGPEIDEMGAGGDRRVGHPDVVAHVRRVQDDIRVGDGRCKRRRIFDINRNHSLRRAQATEQGSSGIGPDVSDGHLVLGAIDEVRDSCRTHLTRAAENEDPRHGRVLSGRATCRRRPAAGRHCRDRAVGES